MQTIRKHKPRLTADAIRCAAIDVLGVADASVVRHESLPKEIYLPRWFTEEPIEVGGEWYVLSVRRERGNGFEVIARRQTLGELLRLVESRMAWESTGEAA